MLFLAAPPPQQTEPRENVGSETSKKSKVKAQWEKEFALCSCLPLTFFVLAALFGFLWKHLGFTVGGLSRRLSERLSRINAKRALQKKTKSRFRRLGESHTLLTKWAKRKCWLRTKQEIGGKSAVREREDSLCSCLPMTFYVFVAFITCETSASS